MKKKVLTVALIGVLSFSMPINAFAAEDDLIDAQQLTENSAVYAEELGDNIGHINGPIEVETVSDSTTINYNYGQGGDSGKDSYVGETINGAAITTNDNVHKDEVINIGPEVQVNEESGTANHSPVNLLTKEEVTKKNQEIKNTLQEIADEGEKAMAAGKENRITNEEEFVNKTRSTNEQLKTVTQDKPIVIDVAGEVLSDGNNYNSLNQEISGLIYNNQNKNTIIVNVKVPDREEYVISYVEMNRNYQSYDPLADFLFWNFGSYNKTITINPEWGGVILAPAATVNLRSGIHSGRVVAKKVTTGGEIHNSVSDKPQPEETEPTPTTEKDPDPEDETPTSEQESHTDEPSEEETDEPTTEDEEPSEKPTCSCDLEKEEETKNPTTTTIEPLKNNTKTIQQKSSPKTGDDTNIIFWIGLFIISLIIVILTGLKKREKE